MTTKKNLTKKSPRLQKVRTPVSHLQQLREQSMALSDLSTMGYGAGTISEVHEEMMKAMAPLRYLNTVAIDFSEGLNEFIVSGYLTLFLRHMDYLLGQAERLTEKVEQEKQQAA